MEKAPTIYLAILNITSWAGQCADAEHLYGQLILSEKSTVNIDNVSEWNVNHLGKKIRITRPLTMEMARKFDKKDGGGLHQRTVWRLDNAPELLSKNPDMGETERFDTFEQVVSAGIMKWKELGIDCPFISLYDGEKYSKNAYNNSESIILKTIT